MPTTNQDKIIDSQETQIEFDDMESYGASVSGIKGLVMSQYNRCCLEGSKEMVVGGVRKILFNGQVIDKVVPNQIETFINSIEMLKIVLEPFIEKHKKYIQTRLEDFNDKLNELDELYEKKLNELEEWARVGKTKWLEKHDKEYNEKLSRINKSYEDKRVIVYKQLLVVLSFLISKENYFEEIRGRA